jgi:hypothetical protein
MSERKIFIDYKAMITGEDKYHRFARTLLITRRCQHRSLDTIFSSPLSWYRHNDHRSGFGDQAIPLRDAYPSKGLH